MMQQEKEISQVEETIHCRPIMAYSMAGVFLLFTFIFLFLFAWIAIFFALIMLICLWWGFCSDKKTDINGLYWRTLWGQKQFVAWEDIADCYIGRESSEIIVLRNGRKIRLNLFGETNETPLQKLKERIGEKVGLQNPEDWDIEGIRPHENWEYIFSEKSSITKIGVDREGLAWQTASGSGTATWDQVIGMRLEEDKYLVVSLAGTEEDEFRFSPMNCKTPNYPDLHLGTIIQKYSPALRDKKLQGKDEVLHVATPKSTYPISGAKIYSYDTKRNQMSRMSGFTPFVGFIPLAINALRFHKNILDWIFISIFGIILIILCYFQIARYLWYKNAQIEIDDLGIALVGAREVKWRLAWLSVMRYEESRWTGAGTLTTRDGKKYTFPGNTADRGELDEEIKRRITPVSTSQF
jgi:hypothetical protein